MSKKCYHFFGGLLNAQANWLNKMSEKGYRLIRAGKMLYEFEECKPNEVKYCVEFIGEKSKENAKDYSLFLEDMGYKVFFKNINLNYSVGKVRWRPWAVSAVGNHWQLWWGATWHWAIFLIPRRETQNSGKSK